MQMLELFLDEQVMNLIVNSTNTFANVDKNNQSFKTDINEIRKFIGILYFSGIHQVPQTDLYWSEQPVFRCDIIKAAMNRDRFRAIKSYFHVCNNSEINASDKFAKVAPLNNMLNEKFMQFGIFAHHLSIDEQMIPYYGRHSAKQFIRGKPIRFGYKFWNLCSHDGYLFQFIPYGGASSENSPEFGLGENVVLRLLSNVDEPSQHTVTFDNFFTSHKLMCRLCSMGYFATGTKFIFIKECFQIIFLFDFQGTVRDNRTAKANLTDMKLMKKEDRGNIDFSFDKKNEIAAIRWNDNAIVTVMSNHLLDEPLKEAKRYDRKKKKYVNIPMPNAIFEYNKTMGGVDLFDNATSNYRIGIRGKKWYWPLSSNALDAALVNAWKIYCICQKYAKQSPMSQLQFRAFVVDCLLRSEAAPSSKFAQPNQPIRFDKINHTIVNTGKRLRCRQCQSQTVFSCEKCKVSVHPKCFDAYHTK